MTLSTIQMDTQANPDCAVIWLHGLGASGHDFEPIVEQLNLPKTLRVRFIFPHAPVQPVSLNHGIPMPAWYDIYGLEIESKEDAEGIKRIKTDIDALIATQKNDGIPVERIVLAGFSQGGALTLFVGLSHTQKLAGLIVLSAYLPLRHELEDYAAHTDRSLPLFLAHGSYDDVVPLEFAQIAQQKLEQQGFNIDLKLYPCAHNVCAEEISDIRAWLLKTFKNHLAR